jgi:hypothetical protein
MSHHPFLIVSISSEISGDQVMFCSCIEVSFFLYGYALPYYTVRDLERFIASSCITLGYCLLVSAVAVG